MQREDFTPSILGEVVGTLNVSDRQVHEEELGKKKKLLSNALANISDGSTTSNSRALAW